MQKQVLVDARFNVEICNISTLFQGHTHDVTLAVFIPEIVSIMQKAIRTVSKKSNSLEAITIRQVPEHGLVRPGCMFTKSKGQGTICFVRVILGLQPRVKAAMLVVNTKEIFLLNLHQNRVHFPAGRNAFVLDHQHGRRDVTCKPAIGLKRGE